MELSLSLDSSRTQSYKECTPVQITQKRRNSFDYASPHTSTHFGVRSPVQSPQPADFFCNVCRAPTSFLMYTIPGMCEKCTIQLNNKRVCFRKSCNKPSRRKYCSTECFTQSCEEATCEWNKRTFPCKNNCTQRVFNKNRWCKECVEQYKKNKNIIELYTCESEGCSFLTKINGGYCRDCVSSFQSAFGNK